jgi:hypothetical protein
MIQTPFVNYKTGYAVTYPSPRNRERPWTRDLQTLSPRSWEAPRIIVNTAGDATTSSKPVTSIEPPQNKSKKAAENSTGRRDLSYMRGREVPLCINSFIDVVNSNGANPSHAVDHEQAMRGPEKTLTTTRNLIIVEVLALVVRFQ